MNTENVCTPLYQRVWRFSPQDTPEYQKKVKLLNALTEEKDVIEKFWAERGKHLSNNAQGAIFILALATPILLGMISGVQQEDGLHAKFHLCVGIFAGMLTSLASIMAMHIYLFGVGNKGRVSDITEQKEELVEDLAGYVTEVWKYDMKKGFVEPSRHEICQRLEKVCDTPDNQLTLWESCA